MTEGIDLSNLAQQMLNWEKKRRELDELEEAIRDTVLQLQKTQTVGNVRATYSKPRNSYDYEGPVQQRMETGEEIDQELYFTVLEHTSTRTVTDWRAVCKALRVEPDVTPGEGPGSVSIKLLG